MTEATARQHLREMLGHFTPGRVLHLLADIFREDAEEARQDDPQAQERYKAVEATLFVGGMGVDAACPR